MNLEFFPDGGQDYPLILIYGHDIDGSLNLSLAIESVATGLVEYIDIHTIPDCISVNGCQLRLQLRQDNFQGVKRKGVSNFIWGLSSEECYDVIGLLEPFSQRNDTRSLKHQHQLLEQHGEIMIVFSTDRQW